VQAKLGAANAGTYDSDDLWENIANLEAEM
jgi:hypothetical protein